MATLKYWLWLSGRNGAEGRPELKCRVLEHFGTPEAAYFADPQEYDLLPGLPAALRASLEDKDLAGAESTLEQCAKNSLRILTAQDAEYPERLRQLYDYPLVLYVKGKWFPFDEMAAIGVVGARQASGYGVAMASRLGLELSRGGALVVSGMAEGIDAAAVRGALQAGGTPVSVLGGGVDVPYPYENRFLYDDVAAVGALVSEYPPGTRPVGHHFPVRNRIISGLSLGVCVVEAREERSGSLITARLALEQNRDVFAVPGAADAPMSRGANRLIQRGEAKLVLDGEDILSEYRGRYPVALRRDGPLSAGEAEQRLERLAEAPSDSPREEAVPVPSLPALPRQEARASLTDDQIAVLEALGSRTLLSDQIIEETQLPARRVLSALTLLQVGGYVKEAAGKRFSAAVTLN